MAKKKGSNPRVQVTIKGEAVWPKLDVPDSYTAPGAKEPKVFYKTNIKVSDEDLKRLKAQFTKVARDFLEAEGEDLDDEWRPKLPFQKDKETKEVTIIATSGAKYKPPLFDSRNRRMPDDVAVGGGSVIKVNVTVNPYPMQGGGVNLYINAIQVLDLKEKAGFNGKSPFDEEDGFEFDGADRADSGSKGAQQERAGATQDDDEIPF